METSSFSPASQNPSRAGRRRPSTAFRKELENLRSLKLSPKVGRAGTPSSVQRTPNRTQEGANRSPAIWNGFLLVHRALRRSPQVERLCGPKESFTTSTTFSHLQVTTQSCSLRWLLAPKPRRLILTDCCSRLAQTDCPPKSLLVSWTVESASVFTFWHLYLHRNVSVFFCLIDF